MFTRIAFNPNGLHCILEHFALIIQSGRNVSLDNHTRLTICADSPILGSAKVCGANEGDELCFSYAFALALAKQQRDKDCGCIHTERY